MIKLVTLLSSYNFLLLCFLFSRAAAAFSSAGKQAQERRELQETGTGMYELDVFDIQCSTQVTNGSMRNSYFINFLFFRKIR